MKKSITFFSTILLSILCLTSNAQEISELEKKIEGKQKYFMENLELDETQAENFQEVYQRHSSQLIDMKIQQIELEKQFGDQPINERLEGISEGEAHEIVNRKLEQMERKCLMKMEYYQSLLEAIGPVNILKLQQLEKTFGEKPTEDSDGAM